MVGKTLANLVETFLEKKRTCNIDTKLKFIIGGTELGTVAIEGKIEYVPSETKEKTDA